MVDHVVSHKQFDDPDADTSRLESLEARYSVSENE